MMDFIIGGAYQGKLTFAKNKYGLKVEDIFTCAESDYIDFSARCVRHIEAFTFWCVKNGEDPVAYFKTHKKEKRLRVWNECRRTNRWL